MDEVINIAVAPREDRRITFRIGDEEYAFRVPKSYGLVSAIRGLQRGDGPAGQAEVEMFARVEDWLFEALEPAQAERLRDRLNDPDDALDTEHVLEVFQQLVKAASERPSGQRRSD